MTQEDIEDILEAFRQSGFARLELTLGSIRVAADRAPAAATRPAEAPPGSGEIVAPLLGTFQAGLEGAPAFVQPGSRVQPDTTVGIIRVMQKSTPVKAGLRGTVLEVLVADGQLVEFGQKLLRVHAG